VAEVPPPFGKGSTDTGTRPERGLEETEEGSLEDIILRCISCVSLTELNSCDHTKQLSLSERHTQTRVMV